MPNYIGFIFILLKEWNSNSSSVFIHLKWRNVDLFLYFERARDKEYVFKLPPNSAGWLIKYDLNVYAFFTFLISEILCETGWEMGI